MSGYKKTENIRRMAALLMAGSMLAGSGAAFAQDATPVQVAPATAPVAADTAPGGVIRSIAVVGNQRLEAQTVLSYIALRVGERYDRAALDQALKELAATELFTDFQIRDDQGNLTIQVTENPVVNRILLEGNKRLKDDKINPEIKLAPRQIYTRSKVRADVARIIELYKRQGRFAATVEPKLVQLDQNRVDVIFVIEEGPKSKVRQINIIGNDQFSDGKLRGEMATKQARLTSILSSNTSYDPDRLAYDQAKLREFYLSQGYADFRVVSAVAEQTSDKQDFIITYVVEEGPRYKFGDVKVDSSIRDFDNKAMEARLGIKSGDWFNAKRVEETVDALTETAGLFGYAFAKVSPRYTRNPDDLTMGITFQIAESPRVYIERIDVNGNTLTEDKVVRREFRLAEGDAFNSFLLKRSENRIKSLGFFQEDLTIEQKEGSSPDRIVLEANVEEKSTGQLTLSAGFSSIENFLLQGSIQQKNFRGKGQILGASVNYSSYSKSAELSFTEPYFLDRTISLGGSVYRRDLNSFNFINNNRQTTFQQTTTGLAVQAGTLLNEYLSASLQYRLNIDNVSLDESTYFFNGQCDPLRAGRFLCDAIGNRTTSLVGYTINLDHRNNRLRPTRGYFVSLGQDLAGLGGSVKYLKSRLNAGKYIPLTGKFVLGLTAEAGYIFGYGGNDVRLTDRFFLGEPQFRGFDIRGVGPRVKRYSRVDVTDPANPIVDFSNDAASDDALGGNAYYLARAEVEIPLGAGASDLGLRPSVFLDVGSLFKVKQPNLTTLSNTFTDTDGNVKAVCRDIANGTSQFAERPSAGDPPVPATAGPFNSCPTGFQTILPFTEQFFGNSYKPRLSIGFGVNWNSPFGPFRIDIARALLTQKGDDTKLFTFNVGTQF